MNRIAVITGGGRGIGRDFALTLARAGWDIAVTGRNRAPLEDTAKRVEQLGRKAMVATCDVVDPAGVDAAFAQISRDFGPIDLLVNNAGVNTAVETLWRVDPDLWWREVEINLRGCFLCARAVLPAMVERASGRIVNIASNAGVFRWPYCSAYSVSKAALIKMSENLAWETRKHKIAVFAFHPGFVKGGLADNRPAVPPSPDTPAGKVYAWVDQELKSDRAVTPQQSADALAKLVSGRYDALTGRYLTVHDDLDALASRAQQIQTDDALTLRLKALT